MPEYKRTFGGGDQDGQAPPAGLAGDPEEAAERWAWDLCGYLVLPGIMDEEWQEECLASIDANSDLVVDRTHHRTFPRDHEGDSTAGSRALVELLALPEPHSSPFARSESSNGCPSHLTTRGRLTQTLAANSDRGARGPAPCSVDARRPPAGQPLGGW